MERSSSDDVDVQALKREVELLKTLLQKERTKSSTNGASQRDVSPTRPISPVKPVPVDRLSFRASSTIKAPPPQSQESDGDRANERSLQKNIALSSASQRGKSMRWNSTSSAQSPAVVSERAMYLQHVPVDTKRDKWWLKDRQILSRNVPSPFDDCIAMKVRETWLWSGRTVVVDKIVTCPNAVDESDEFNDRGARREDHHDDGEEEEHEDRRDDQQVTACGSPENKPNELHLDSKQLAQEFMLPKAASGASGSTSATSEPLQAASARMEHQMSVAAAEKTAEKTSQQLDSDQASSPGKAHRSNHHAFETTDSGTLDCFYEPVDTSSSSVTESFWQTQMRSFRISISSATMIGAFGSGFTGIGSAADSKRKLQDDASAQNAPMNQDEHSTSTLEAFMKIANEINREVAAPPPPAWISQAEGSITPDTFQMDLLLHVADLGGGLQRDDLLITPNTSVEAYNICRRLGHIEMHPFMQTCMARLPDDAHFLSVMRLFEDPGLNACPVHFVPPPAPFRQMFFCNR